MGTDDTPTEEPILPADSGGGDPNKLARLRQEAQDLGIAIEKTLRLKELERERIKALEDYVGMARSAIESQQEMLVMAKRLAAVESHEERAKQLDNLTNEFRKLQEENKLSTEQVTKFSQAVEKLKQGTITVKEFNVSMEEQRGELVNTTQAIERQSPALNKFSDALGMATKASGTFGGSMIEMWSDLTMKDGGEQNLANLAAGLKTMFSVTNLAVNAAAKIMDFAISLDKVGSEFGRATGFGRGFEGQIIDVAQASVRSGVSMQEAGQAMQALATNFSKFNKSAERTNKILATNIAMLDKLGVSTDTSTKIMDGFVRQFGKGELAAAKMTTELIGDGVAMGRTAKQMASDFESSFGKLSQFGSEAVNVFKGMEAQAKASGLAIGDLISIAEKFDTFEGAADNAAKLNAVLGTQLSAVDLLNADYEETIDLLRGQIQASVGNFDAMDRHTQMMVAQVVAGGDVAKAQKLINMNTEEYLGYKGDMQASAMTQAELAERTAELVPIMEKLQLQFAEFALTAAPAIEGLVKAFTLLFTPIAGVFSIMDVMIPGLIAYAGLMQIVAIAETVRTAGLWAMSAASAAAWGRMGLVLLAGWMLVEMFKTRINPIFALIFHFLAGGLMAMAVAAQVGGWKLIGLVAALALVVAAVALVVYGIAEVIKAITGLFALMIESASVLPKTAFGIYLVAGAVGALGIATLLSIGAVFLLLAALTGIGAVIAGVGMLTGASMLGQVGDDISKIGDGLGNFASSLATIKSVVSELRAMGSDGFMAVTVDGGKTSMIMASEGTIRNVDTSNINVKVDIPEIKAPDVTVHVYLDSEEISTIVKGKMIV